MAAVNIHTLPRDDTIKYIVKYLDDGHVINLSMSCKELREQLACHIFHTVRFSNDPKISNSALIAAQKHGHHVRVLRFVGFAGEEDDNQQSQNEHPRPTNRDVLPYSALILFEANAALLPNLETIVINFDHDYGEADEYGPHGPSIFINHESLADVRQREAKLTMCRLWANTYKALAANKGTPNLVIESWSPRGVSTFQTKAWKAYMRRVKSLDITIVCETLAFEFTNSLQGYGRDVGAMQQFFFQWLDLVTTLKVSMLWPVTPFGMNGKYHIPLPMRTNGSMPVLGHLELKHVFISEDLLNLIIGHKEHLHTVVLHNAHSALAKYGECATRGISWKDFFDCLTMALNQEGGLALTTFTFTSTAPLSETEAKTEKINYKSERAAIKKLRDQLQNDPSRRLFGYGDMGEISGTFIHDIKTNQDSAIAGEDQTAYERFVKRLEVNRQRISNTKQPMQCEKGQAEITQLVQCFETMEGLGAVIHNTDAPISQTVGRMKGYREPGASRKKHDSTPSSSNGTMSLTDSRSPEDTGLRRSARLANKTT
ncbi:hypothetical protein QBC38DRAFT_547031 [Podospora fimiseda]|uniref:F-box domain-containing protein n=1 Tax=Podospora fimiseda TaxID=252190 RepID=A0AAN7BKW5_9PEZI|nr:hypothetical protein QBC38DRAFT_547031 [Podospora fimiseda]